MKGRVDLDTEGMAAVIDLDRNHVPPVIRTGTKTTTGPETTNITIGTATDTSTATPPLSPYQKTPTQIGP